ncbi:hypothetical protein [Streptosporangium sandarakinum]
MIWAHFHSASSAQKVAGRGRSCSAGSANGLGKRVGSNPDIASQADSTRGHRPDDHGRAPSGGGDHPFFPESGTWHGSLLPFAATDYGQELFVDPRTGRVGEKEYGRNLRYDGPMGWPSYLALLEALADSLETGRPIRGWRPVVRKGELDWKQAR